MYISALEISFYQYTDANALLACLNVLLICLNAGGCQTEIKAPFIFLKFLNFLIKPGGHFAKFSKSVYCVYMECW